MEPERRNQLLLAVLVVVLAVVAYRAWPRAAPAAPLASTVTSPPRAAGRRAVVAAPDVHLEALDAERTRPGDTDRNLFRFKPKPPPPPPPPEPKVTRSAGTVLAPNGAPPTPPIALKFIGVVEAPEHSKKIAVLSDGRGVYYGVEGGTIEGRYRILRIGAESIEMAYLDGRGRQTIRLSGS